MKRILKGRPEGRIRTIRIERWSEFIRIVEGWDGFRNWAFRGQGNAAWELRSSLARHIEVSKVGERSWARQEVRIRRIFKRKAHLYLSNVPGEDELEWIALMQHHGAPTRLLDLSWSPYVAAFFALERATSEAAVWAFNLALLWQLHERHEIDGVAVNSADPRIAGIFDKYFQPNRHAFVWQGDPFRMPQRVIAQSGTFLVSGHLGRTIEEIIATYPGRDVLLVKFVFDTARVRADAMASLYSMNITQATLFPGLDGMARSMAYEFEYSWEVDLATDRLRASLRDPILPEEVLKIEGPALSGGAADIAPVPQAQASTGRSPRPRARRR